MAPPIVHTVSEFIELTFSAAFSVGLEDAPVRPWYLGQASEGDSILPPLYRSSIEPALERELLREFRMRAAEFIPPGGVPDELWPILGHQQGLPTRIQEWYGNPLTALFFAVESMSANDGQVWVFNPWYFNEVTARLAMIPMTNSPLFRDEYCIVLDDPNAAPAPSAEAPMCFKPFRNIRPQGQMDTYFIVHGHSSVPLNEFRLFLRRPDTYLKRIIIAGESKSHLRKELHLLGVNHATLVPGAGSVAKAAAYALSRDFLETEI
jgi:hypothetical protein